jgi:15-cis-phytoene synthase
LINSFRRRHNMAETMSIEQAYAQSAALIRQGSKSFYAASRLLPADIRHSAYALYAFCRMSDDAVDLEEQGTGRKREAVERLRERLDLAYSGRPKPIAADIAFADMVHRHTMPRALPLALIDGLAFDAEGGRCASLSDLFAYSARVAGSVGAMMTVLMGVREPVILARACDLGVAMQLTNIARDVGEDARAGRLYLPLDWLAEEGIDAEAFLAAPRFDQRVAALVARLLGEAEGLYRRSVSGISGLPLACRPAMHAARIIYREIGRSLAATGHDSINRRAIVPDSRKLMLLGGALGRTIMPRLGVFDGPLPETAFLVEAVIMTAAPWRKPRNPIERVSFALDLMARMRERERKRGTMLPAQEQDRVSAA